MTCATLVNTHTQTYRETAFDWLYYQLSQIQSNTSTSALRAVKPAASRNIDSELLLMLPADPCERGDKSSVLEPGEARSPGSLQSGLTKYSVHVCLPIHTSHVPKQWDVKTIAEVSG